MSGYKRKGLLVNIIIHLFIFFSKLLKNQKIKKNMANFDADLKKAFQELQVKVITTTQQVKLAESQIAQLTRNVTHAKLTDQELSTLPEDTRTYQAIGRMFMLEPINEVRASLKKKIKEGEEKVKTIDLNKVHLQKSVKDQENNIREMLSARQ